MSDNAVKTVAPKMVREADLIAVKKQRDDFRAKLANKDGDIAQLKSELKMAKANLDEDGEADVRKYLTGRDEELNEREAKLEKQETDLRERESSQAERDREDRIKSLAAEYGVEIDAIRDAEDPEKAALKLERERLVKEKENPAENAFESNASGGRVKKNVYAMNDEELKAYEEELKARVKV